MRVLTQGRDFNDGGRVAVGLNLAVDVQRAVLGKLDQVGGAVGAVQLNIVGIPVAVQGIVVLAEGLVGQGQGVDNAQVLRHLDIKVAGVGEAALIQVRNVLIGFVLGIRGAAHGLAVEPGNTGGRLQRVVHMGGVAPDLVAFADAHVVHLNSSWSCRTWSRSWWCSRPRCRWAR